MKIGIDARMYSTNFTGIGRYVFELTEHLFRMDKENEYVLFFNNPEYDKFDDKRFNGRVKKVLVDVPHYSLKEQTKLLSALRKEKLDLMHFTHFNAPIFYIRPKVVTIHDLTLTFFPGKKMTGFKHRAGYHATLHASVTNAKHVIAVSENTKSDIQKIYGLPRENVSVIYEGVNPNFKIIEDKERLEKVRNQYNLKKPFFLYTGVWRGHKNLVALIEAFAELLNQYDLDIDLVMTGKEDPHYPEVKQAVADSKLNGRVKFPGLVPEDDLVALYNLAEVYVLPSFYEGFGLTPLEAFACGTPVCASNTSCIPEICGEGNALFFDPNKKDDIISKMYEVYMDKELKKSLVKKGLKRIEDFSWEQMGKETFEVYKKVLKM